MKTNIPADINTYISQFPNDVQVILEQIRTVIQQAAPTAVEAISYGMPAFKLHGKPLVYFAAFKRHIGLYALPSGNQAFKQELAAYKTGKGSIQFPLEEPMPLDLLKKIVVFRVSEIATINAPLP